MKKLSKVLTILTSCALAASAFGSISANAWGFSNTQNPVGYEEFDDYGIFDAPLEYFSYKTYMGMEDDSDIMILSDPSYNDLCLRIEDNEAFSSIFNKYKKDLDFEYSHCSSNYYSGYDKHDANGNTTFDMSSIPDRTPVIKALCKELYEADAISLATYSRFSADMKDGSLMIKQKADKYEDYIYDYDFEISDLTCDEAIKEEEVRELVKSVDEKFDVKKSDDVDEYAPIANNYTIFGAESLKETLSAAKVLRENYPKAKLSMDAAFAVDVSERYESNKINLLDPYICDIDGNGEADISDATLVLSDYAQKMAGVQTASNNNMDANGDGEVNIDDVSYILTYYADASAGLR